MGNEHIITCEGTIGISFIASNVLTAIEEAKTPAEKMQQILMFASLCSLAGDKINVADEDKPRLLSMLDTAEKLAMKVINDRG